VSNTNSINVQALSMNCRIPKPSSSYKGTGEGGREGGREAANE
jgi:hypothetical protein